MNRKGFTLIELLVVIAIIAILAVVVFVALDPATRFADARDAVRSSNTNELLSAIKIDQVDNGGGYLASMTTITDEEVYMISDTTAGCDDLNAYCDTSVTSDTHCINLTGLVTEGYLGAVPISPDGLGAWTSSITGYTLEKNATGTIQIRACESENTTEIEVVR